MGGGAQIVLVLDPMLWLAVTLPVAVLIDHCALSEER
jgi:hypothetical protein